MVAPCLFAHGGREGTRVLEQRAPLRRLDVERCVLDPEPRGLLLCMLAIPEQIRAHQHDVDRLARADPEERVGVDARFGKFSKRDERASAKQRAGGPEVEEALAEKCSFVGERRRQQHGAWSACPRMRRGQRERR